MFCQVLGSTQISDIFLAQYVSDCILFIYLFIYASEFFFASIQSSSCLFFLLVEPFITEVLQAFQGVSSK